MENNHIKKSSMATVYSKEVSMSMIGCRPLSAVEVDKVILAFTGDHKIRNELLFYLGITTGFRIQEILSITVGDVWKQGKIPPKVEVARKHMKGKKKSRSAFLLAPIKKLVKKRLDEIGYSPETFLFLAAQGENKAIDRRRAWEIIDEAKTHANIHGKLGTHCMRKTFARIMYREVGYDLNALMELLDHRDLKTTQAYISFEEDKMEKAVKHATFRKSS